MHADEAVEILERTPDTVRAMLGELSEGWIRADGAGVSWTPFDIVGHLISGDRTDWIPRARMILEHGESRPFEPFDRTAMFERSRGLTMADLLARFEEARAESLAALRILDLSDEGLARRGLHPELGSVTLGELLATWAAHDLSHIGQIAEVMAKRYREAVGPWRAYLPALDRPDDE